MSELVSSNVSIDITDERVFFVYEDMDIAMSLTHDQFEEVIDRYKDVRGL